jgi:hypothetical protein
MRRTLRSPVCACARVGMCMKERVAKRIEKKKKKRKPDNKKKA